MMLLVKMNGFEYPEFEGQALSWSIGLYFTAAEAELDYPRARTVIRAMMEHRPAQLHAEYWLTRKGCSDRCFGRQARAFCRLIISEVGDREGFCPPLEEM